ncbi:MAG: S1/P1 nuclease [Terriglobia bacterium]
MRREPLREPDAGNLHVRFDEDNSDRRGNVRQVIFDGHPDNLHWVWDTGLPERLGRNSHGLARRLEKRITAEEVVEWHSGTALQWANQAHEIARAVAYGQLAKGNPRLVIYCPSDDAEVGRTCRRR